MNSKTWNALCALKTESGEIIHYVKIVEAETIRRALDAAEQDLREEIESREDVIDSGVYAVIIQDDLF